MILLASVEISPIGKNCCLFMEAFSNTLGLVPVPGLQVPTHGLPVHVHDLPVLAYVYLRMDCQYFYLCGKYRFIVEQCMYSGC